MVKLLLAWWRDLWGRGLRPGSVSSLVFALVCVAVATLLRSALGELDLRTASGAGYASNAFASYYSATLVAALVGGVPAGVVAAISGALAGFWFFVPPDWRSHVFDWDQMVSALIFSVSSGIIIWAAKSYRDLLRQLRQEQERRQLLNHELVHRIKNTLAIVQSVISQTLRGQPAMHAKLSDRIGALAATNDLLIKSEWRGASLMEILAGEFAPYDPAQFTVTGADLACPSEIATVLALIMHELTTNAAKYGALSTPHGRIDLSWVQHRDRIDFDWIESGGPAPNPAPNPARRTGFGTTLLRKGLRQFDGAVDMEFTPGGLHCKISLPLSWSPQDDAIDIAPGQPPPAAVRKTTAGHPRQTAAFALHPPRIASQK
ncbi:MAG: sensor histidine kinase [Xanthobacteraceae bacterium]